MKRIVIGIVGDFCPDYKNHILLNRTLDRLGEERPFGYEWIGTETVGKGGDDVLEKFSGFWSATGSPFKSLTGALRAIEFARTRDIPHLGTCGGFQHLIVEFARNVLKIPGAQHEEYDPAASDLFISRLVCSLAGRTMSVRIKENTLASKCYGSETSTEDYYCNFGINPTFRDRLNHPELVVSGVDQDGEIRIVENPKNEFFMGTLFVPQSRADREPPHPVIRAFVEASIRKGS